MFLRFFQISCGSLIRFCKWTVVVYGQFRPVADWPSTFEWWVQTIYSRLAAKRVWLTENSALLNLKFRKGHWVKGRKESGKTSKHQEEGQTSERAEGGESNVDYLTFYRLEEWGNVAKWSGLILVVDFQRKSRLVGCKWSSSIFCPSRLNKKKRRDNKIKLKTAETRPEDQARQSVAHFSLLGVWVWKHRAPERKWENERDDAFEYWKMFHKRLNRGAPEFRRIFTIF